MKTVYILLTEKKVHIYGSWSRAMKIHQRAARMNVEHEYLSGDVKTGDRFKKTKVREYGWPQATTECSQYARAEAGFADSRGE